MTESPRQDPYDIAVAIRDKLLDPNEFQYDTDLTDERCDVQSIVECFVITRAGFCQYYASTMAVFLRAQGIPARYVQGFLPGEPDPIGNVRTIRSQDAHAWVQAYFPGYGWIDFDPTGGPNQGALTPIPLGSPVASATPKPSSSGSGAVASPTFRDFGDGTTGQGQLPNRGGPPVALLIGIFILAPLLTPPDAISQCSLAIPMYLLYEGGIVMARLLSRGQPATDGIDDGREMQGDRKGEDPCAHALEEEKGARHGRRLRTRPAIARFSPAME